MRYYKYGKDKIQHEVEANEERQEGLGRHFGKLIIDEDSVYEIDEECLQCHKKEAKTAGKLK
ncbi:hypothetical protein D7V86_07600 [bacterium D16-51]|nr:hypothetical protein D7V96_10025 [bacterium D16-59]RKI60937.1 hypothetical protein D7V86_07600 [bacterium D16-51]